MKKTNTCPKCGSHEILRVKDTGGNATNALMLGFLSVVPVPRYVCCGCGYTEEWVDQKDLWVLKDELKIKRAKENN